MRSTVTMNDIAARAGVSQATVSFVLNNRRNGVSIPTETRQRVLDIANELGYRRNQLARAMVTGQSRTLGVITVSRSGTNIVRILVGILEAANQRDYLVKIMHLSDGQVDDSTVNRCIEWRVAGAIVVGLEEASSEFLYGEFLRVGIPVAFVDNAPHHESGLLVRSDERQGMGAVIDHLVNLGHRRIAFLGGRVSALSLWREESFRDSTTAAGIIVPDAWIRNTSWHDPAPMEQEARAILALPDRPSAIVCAADTIAMIVMRVARSLGIRLPEELSITGYSNTNLSAFADPPLTTVEQPFQEMGYAAASDLIGRAETKKGAEELVTVPEILLPTQLLIRGSTAPFPPSPFPAITEGHIS